MVLFPQWFLAPDLIIDFFSFIILLAFTTISLKYYKLSKNKKFLYLGLAFLLIGLGELVRIIMYLGTNLNLSTTYRIGRVIIESGIISSADIFYFVGFSLYRFLLMLGFYLIYFTTKREKTRLEHLLIIYFIFILTLFTNESYHIFNIGIWAYHIFNFTIAVFIFIIVINYIRLYQERKSGNTKILIYSFFLLLISYITIIFARKEGNIYIAANTLQLISYVLFLTIIIRIYKHGKKKQG